MVLNYSEPSASLRGKFMAMFKGVIDGFSIRIYLEWP